MTVLVLGASGFIGPHLVRALRAAGHEVVPGSRTGQGGVVLDRRDAKAVRALVRERGVRAVVDLLAYVEADTLPLLDALDGEVERWVMASSCDVYRNYEGLQRRGAPAPILTPLSEDGPLRTRLYPYRSDPLRSPEAADAWMDAYDKIPLEAALRGRPGLDGVVMRLPMVFGPGDRQRRFAWLLAPMLSGAERLTVDPAWAAWRTTYGYVENVAHALAAAVSHPAAAKGTFNLGEAETPDHRDWIGRFARALGWRGAVQTERAPAGGPLAGLDMRYPLILDTGVFRAVCGWREPVGLASALERTVADARGWA